MNILISLTEQCNLRCTYCYYNESHKDRSFVMDFETLKKSITLAFERTIQLKENYVNITFFGGEPLLRYGDIKKAVSFAKKLAKDLKQQLPKDFRLQLAINTNGTLLSDAIIAFLKKEHFRIYLSLDGPAIRHNIARKTINGKGSFYMLSPYLKALTQMDTVILTVVTPKHIKGLCNTVKWVHRLGFRVMTTAPDYDGNWTIEDFDNLALEYQKMALFWCKLKMNNDKFIIGTIQDKISYEVFDIRQKSTTCNMVKGGISVAANGNIFPCTRFISCKKDAPYQLGNINDPLDKIFEGKIAKEIYTFLKNDRPECKKCAIKRRCHGHECGCTSFYTTGNIHKVSTEACTHERILAAICDEATEKLLESKNILEVI